MQAGIREFLQTAAAKREHLQNITNACRLCNGKADGLDGVVLDKYGTHYQIQFFNSEFLKFEAEIISAAKELFAPHFLAIKYRMKDGDKFSRTAFGDNSKTVVEENGIKFAVDLMDTMNPGLFLDMRDARIFFAQKCAGREVLNLFAYTCSFSVYARKHGAAKAVSVDISKKNLSKGKENFALNDLSVLPGEFFCGSAEEYVDWCIKKEKRFGAIAIDPPSFSKNGKRIFKVADDAENLTSQAARILESDGILLLASNYSEWDSGILQKTAERAFAKNFKTCRILKRGTQGADFPGCGEIRESSMFYLVASFI